MMHYLVLTSTIFINVHHMQHLGQPVLPSLLPLLLVQFYLANGLAPSARQVYTSTQCNVLKSCNEDVPSSRSQLLLPASEEALMHSCAHLADSASSFFHRLWLP